jgi:pyrroline-5-carboxylate reductase
MSTLMTNKCIGFIGVGVMGSSIIKSLLKHSLNSDQICISDKSAEKTEELATQYKVKIKTISEIGQSCDVIFLAVKPQDLEAVLIELKKTLKPNVLVISIAAGKKIEFIEENLASEVSVVRVMPNTPAQIGKGISAVAAGSKTSKEDMELATQLFLASGEVVEVAEEMLDAVTALSGSGPAYFFNFVESMIKAGIELGLSNEIATKLAIETISGSAAMLKESGLDAQTLRKNVTSPKGTTAAALEVFSDNNFDALVLQAMSAAKKRAQELA